MIMKYERSSVENSMLTWRSNQIPHRALWACHTANSNPRLCATRNSRSRTSEAVVLGMWVVYASRDIGLFVVLVARKRAVNLDHEDF